MSFALSMTSCDPVEDHWEAVIKILMYLRSTKDKFLVFGRISVRCYTKPIIQTSQDRSQSKVFPEHSNRKSWNGSMQSTITDSTKNGLVA